MFALSGGAAAVKGRLDLFGVLVLSFAAANAGGLTRDLLIGAVPPAAISDWRYLGISLLAGLVTFFWYPVLDRLRNPVLVFDGAGLALFAVSGTQKALAYGLEPVMAALLGMLTGIGGGMVRDLLVTQIPTVFARRAVRGGRARRRGRGGGRPRATPAADRSDHRGRVALLRAPPPRHIARLAPADRSAAAMTRCRPTRVPDGAGMRGLGTRP